MGGYFEPQYSSGGVAARWLQHLSSTSSPSASATNPPPTIAMQSAEEKQKLYKLMRSASTGAESFSYGSSRHNMSDGLELLGEEDASGLLDLHSLDDTELLSEDAMPDPFESSPLIHMRERGYENNVDNALCSTNKPHGSSKHTIYSDISPMRSSLIDKESNGNDSSGPARIKVVVRKRPLNKKEISRKEEDIVGIVEHGCSLTVHEPKLKVDLTAYVERHDFMFDAVLGEHVTNDEVYGVTVEPIIPTIFKRTKATCFAYGQTGSGKTYTMRPLPLKASQDILKMMQHSLYRNQGLQLWLSFFEIYGGKLYDLLNDRRKLCMREDGRQQVCIVGLKEFSVSDVQLVNGYIEKGNAARSTGSTGANEESSRSHAILQLVLKKHIGGKDDQGGRVVGKFSFIDLAGSERGADTTDNDRQTRIEGAEINKSLLALKECIRALDHEQGHIPFRGSKLTEVLRDSFIGDSRTVMISCISPNSGSCEHTLNTLRYADRVKGLSKNSNSKRDPSPNTAPNASTLTRCDSSPPSFSSSEVSEYAKGFRNTESIRSGWNVQYGDSEGHSITSSNHIQSGRDSKPAYFPSEKDRYAVKEINVASFSNRQDISGMHGSFDRGEHDRLTSLHQRSNNNEKFDNLGDSNLKDQGKGDGVGTWQRQQIYKEEATMDTVQSILKGPAQSTDFQNGYNRHIAAILEEEEDLISAHRLEVEDSMELVREEMKLLAVIDQPGSRIDQYVSQLSYVLSRKAAGIVNLQARLARFQRHLKEHEIISHNLG